jgi:gluconolactonase
MILGSRLRVNAGRIDRYFVEEGESVRQGDPLVAGGLISLGRAPSLAETGFPAVGRIERVDARFDGLVPPGAVLEKVADGIDWAEGPVWDVRTGTLLFSDVPRNGVFRWTETTAVAPFLPDSGYAGIAPSPPTAGSCVCARAPGARAAWSIGDERTAAAKRSARFSLRPARWSRPA